MSQLFHLMTGSMKAVPTLAIGKMVAFMAHLVRSLEQDSPSLLQWALEPFGSFGALAGSQIKFNV